MENTIKKITTGTNIKATKANVGSKDKSLVYVQETPSAVWTIRHGLNKYPAVTIVDSAGTEVIGGLEYVDKNTVILTFSGEFSGQAFFN